MFGDRVTGRAAMRRSVYGVELPRGLSWWVTNAPEEAEVKVAAGEPAFDADVIFHPRSMTLSLPSGSADFHEVTIHIAASTDKGVTITEVFQAIHDFYAAPLTQADLDAFRDHLVSEDAADISDGYAERLDELPDHVDGQSRAALLIDGTQLQEFDLVSDDHFSASIYSSS
jgi:hypothetical protein